MAYVYIVRCSDDTLYTGIAKDLARRMKSHAKASGAGCAKYMKSHKIIKIEAVWKCAEYRDAARLEYALKQLKRNQKLTLIENDNLEEAIPHLVTADFERIRDVSLEMCLDGLFYG